MSKGNKLHLLKIATIKTHKMTEQYLDSIYLPKKIYQYDIKYADQYNDEITESFEKLSEARTFLKEIKNNEDYTLLRTWRYLAGKYLGNIPPRIK